MILLILQFNILFAFPILLSDSTVKKIYIYGKNKAKLIIIYTNVNNNNINVYIAPQGKELDKILSTHIFESNVLLRGNYFLRYGGNRHNKSKTIFKEGGELKNQPMNLYIVSSSHFYCEHFLIQHNNKNKRCVYTTFMGDYIGKSKSNKNSNFVVFYPKYKGKKFKLKYDNQGNIFEIIFYDYIKKYRFKLKKVL